MANAGDQQALNRVLWPESSLGQAVAALSQAAGLVITSAELSDPAPGIGADHGGCDRWISAAVQRLGLEAIPCEAPYADLQQMVRHAAPALLRVTHDGTHGFLALLAGGRRRVTVLGVDGQRHRLSVAQIVQWLSAPLAAQVVPTIASVLDAAGLTGTRRSRVERALVDDRLRQRPIHGAWLLRLPPGSDGWQQLRREGLTRLLADVVATHTLYYGMWLLSWWIVGRGILSDRLDLGWLLAWGLVLLTLIPCRLRVTWLQGRFAIGAGGLLKRRLLAGVLKLNPEEIRHMGAGQLLGQVIESEAVESLALSGGFFSVVALIELCVAAVVLLLGVSGWWHAGLLLIWVGLVGLLSWHVYQRRILWTETRLTMTNDLVERMVGHRTRLAQEAETQWHDAEDQQLDQYLHDSRRLDASQTALSALPARGWLVLGVLGLGPAFVAGTVSIPLLAVSVGGLLLAYRALGALTNGLAALTGAAISWRQIAPLFAAAARQETVPSPDVALPLNDRARPGSPLLEASDLVFRYPTRPHPVLRGCSLRINHGDRLLLEGPSGGGKSTFAALLTGLREPSAGLILLNGYDRHTLGLSGWRNAVVSAPQFHENHILTETFAFNLLMGRRWPPTAADLAEAEALCVALELGELLQRMPAGMMQMVGDTGWQLSHGERSRVFIARALLQSAQLIVLDESFAALDPETLARCLGVVRERAATLLVIAHP